MPIAIIGLGEVGRCYAEALMRADVPVLLCEAEPSRAARDLSARANLPLHPSVGAWLGEAGWVLSCVAGPQSSSVLREARRHLRPGAGFGDLTTSRPETKREAAREATEAGLHYVDIAVMGAMSLDGVRTPLLAAGEGAGAVRDLLAPLGAPVRVMQGAAGDAASLKMLRSVFTKGMEALAVELLMAAETQGVRAQLYEQLSDIDRTSLPSFLETLVRTHVVHAARRLREVEDAQAELAQQGVPSLVLNGAKARFRATTAALSSDEPREAEPGIEDALQWLLTHASRPATPVAA